MKIFKPMNVINWQLNNFTIPFLASKTDNSYHLPLAMSTGLFSLLEALQ